MRAVRYSLSLYTLGTTDGVLWHYSHHGWARDNDHV